MDGAPRTPRPLERGDHAGHDDGRRRPSMALHAVGGRRVRAVVPAGSPGAAPRVDRRHVARLSRRRARVGGDRTRRRRAPRLRPELHGPRQRLAEDGLRAPRGRTRAARRPPPGDGEHQRAPGRDGPPLAARQARRRRPRRDDGGDEGEGDHGADLLAPPRQPGTRARRVDRHALGQPRAERAAEAAPQGLVPGDGAQYEDAGRGVGRSAGHGHGRRPGVSRGRWVEVLQAEAGGVLPDRPGRQPRRWPRVRRTRTDSTPSSRRTRG